MPKPRAPAYEDVIHTDDIARSRCRITSTPEDGRPSADECQHEEHELEGGGRNEGGGGGGDTRWTRAMDLDDEPRHPVGRRLGHRKARLRLRPRRFSSRATRAWLAGHSHDEHTVPCTRKTGIELWPGSPQLRSEPSIRSAA